jgi:cobalamin biosynthetic protein CobC
LLEHGGRLRLAARHYAIPLNQWLDLSTGINPNGWPVPALPAECWQRLPEDNDELLPAAQAYYQNTSILPVAGSQAAIQALPLLRPVCRVGLMHPAYAEHAASWQKTGHQLQQVDMANIDSQLEKLDVLIIINPNNPTGTLYPPQQLLDWHAKLSRRGGWLIVDEAFIDSLPDYSLSALASRPGLIILRSIGKFFGLAGIRCGFVIAEAELLQSLAEQLGPWTISHPGRYVAAKALADTDWQRKTALDLKLQTKRLRELLTEKGWPPQGESDCFQWLKTDHAASLHVLLAQQGILTRLFKDPASLRFGLPKDESAWQRLAQALSKPAIQRMA